MKTNDGARVNNPFHYPRVTEFLEPEMYRRTFSEQILVGETLEVFQPTNVVLLGPQGAGKSMILNLLRYQVVSTWLDSLGHMPGGLKHLTSPYLGISINLQRANFQVFGRRSIGPRPGIADAMEADAAFAADYLSHYLLREFLLALQFIASERAEGFKRWIGVGAFDSLTTARRLAKWQCWMGYYARCSSLQELLEKCDERLNTVLSFLAINIDEVPDEIWRTKTTLPQPLHDMGNMVRDLTQGRAHLFVSIDQYEVLEDLNERFGSTLRRMVNTLLKARDPVAFYRVGARTYDWGAELRVWGAESKVEFGRDYTSVNLADVLMRGEGKSTIFPAFARDVAVKRMQIATYSVTSAAVKNMFGNWDPDEESNRYFRRARDRNAVIYSKLPLIKRAITRLAPALSTLDVRLADAWSIQQFRRKSPEGEIATALSKRPWKHWSWHKERVGAALLQIASRANQRRLYYGWHNVLYLSGYNILAFLQICSEIWDTAAKRGVDPLGGSSLSHQIQTDGVMAASEKWLLRDRTENPGGARRYNFISRLGEAIKVAALEDIALSNPGHTGMSIRESELDESSEGRDVARFLRKGVNWSVFEERSHTSKNREPFLRRKWYLHPLLCAYFGIPHIRVKEPLYVDVRTVYRWIYGETEVNFKRRAASRSTSAQNEIPFTTIGGGR